MSDVIIPYRFLLRGGTAAALAANNEIVKDREFELETDTGRFKVGNGIDHYNDLRYIGFGFFNPAGLADGDTITWDAATQSWITGAGGGNPILAAGDLIYGYADSNGVVQAVRLPIGTPGQSLIVTPGLLPAWGTDAGVGGTGSINFNIGNGINVILPGTKGNVTIPFDCTIDGIWITSRNGQTGSVVIDIWKDAFANVPPLSGDSICGASKPTIVSSDKYSDFTLTGWDVDVLEGDNFVFNIDSILSFTYLSGTIKVTKT